MSYAGTLRSFPNPVSKMFGLVSRRGVMRAIKLAQEDARLDRIANQDVDMARSAALIKRSVREATRPATASPRTTGSTPDPLVPQG